MHPYVCGATISTFLNPLQNQLTQPKLLDSVEMVLQGFLLIKFFQKYRYK